MSYCRFSSDDWQCDVYVWEDVDGTWHTEVAYRHWTWDVELPEPVEWSSSSLEAFFARSARITHLLDDASSGHWTSIPEPDGGRSYRHETPGECADNLERLRELGLHVPQDAIDSLREEQIDLTVRETVAWMLYQFATGDPAPFIPGDWPGPDSRACYEAQANAILEKIATITKPSRAVEEAHAD